MASGRRLRIGIALGAQSATAVIVGRKGLPAAVVPVSAPEEGDWAGEVVRVFAELKEQTEAAIGRGTDGATVHIAVLPPFADARLVTLPRLRRSEVEAVVKRDVARYFPGGVGPQLVGVRTLVGRGSSPSTDSDADDEGAMRIVVAAGPLKLLETIKGSADQCGWRTASMCAGHGSWLGAAGALKGKPARAIVAVIDEMVHVARLEGSNPVAARRLPVEDLETLGSVLGVGPGRVLLLAPPAAGDRVADELSSKGWVVAHEPAGWTTAEEVAAVHASDGVLELVPPTLAAERRISARRTITRLAAASVAFLIAAGAAQLWGVEREIESVRAQRTEIRDQVEPLLAARDSVSRLSDRIQTVDELTSTTTRWTPALVDLAVLLPTDTHLTALFASGDTLELEAAGSRAGEAIQALRDAGLFREVRLEGVVERELEDGETVIERFRVSARLRGQEGAP